MEGARGGREGGSDNVRQGGSRSRGLREGGLVREREEETKRGMDGARKKDKGGSERRKEGAGREGATERGRRAREE